MNGVYDLLLSQPATVEAKLRIIAGEWKQVHCTIDYFLLFRPLCYVVDGNVAWAVTALNWFSSARSTRRKMENFSVS